ncbi:MAG TPA: hypothetical protein VNQ73_03050 [Ilumatobacter sp.]|nr:hypothetical protein [Ilumatobacter sp.]
MPPPGAYAHELQVAQDTTRAAARAARDLGLSVRDIGQLLDVSPSYAARLVK